MRLGGGTAAVWSGDPWIALLTSPCSSGHGRLEPVGAATRGFLGELYRRGCARRHSHVECQDSGLVLVSGGGTRVDCTRVPALGSRRRRAHVERSSSSGRRPPSGPVLEVQQFVEGSFNGTGQIVCFIDKGQGEFLVVGGTDWHTRVVSGTGPIAGIIDKGQGESWLLEVRMGVHESSPGQQGPGGRR